MLMNTKRMWMDYHQFSQLRSEARATNKLDLSTIAWFYPTLLLPLGLYIRQNRDIEVVSPNDPGVSNYFDIITKTNEADVNKSYIPIIKIPRNIHELDTNKLNCFAENCGGKTPLQYFIGELITNIYEHSSFSTAYVMAQRYLKRGFIEFCIIDNGISIPKSYEAAGIALENDKAALDYALEGKSTKNIEGRGHGLRSSISLLTSGMNGACLIISRRGGLRANRESSHSFDINEKHIYEGTLICIDVPFQEKGLNLYDYLPQ